MNINIGIVSRVTMDTNSYPVHSSNDTKLLREIQRDTDTQIERGRQREIEKETETDRKMNKNKPTNIWSMVQQEVVSLTRQIPIISCILSFNSLSTKQMYSKISISLN